MIEITPDITITSDIAFEPIELNESSQDYDLTGFDFWSSIGFAAVQFIFALIYFAYKLANLAHPNDTGFGNSWFAKITVYIGMVLTMTGVIYVQADLVLTKNTANSQAFNEQMWQGIILLQLIYVWVVAPLAIVFYGSNEDQTWGKRLVGAFKVQLPMFIVLFILAVPTYIWLNECTVPATEAEAYGFTEGLVED